MTTFCSLIAWTHIVMLSSIATELVLLALQAAPLVVTGS
jgi:hypothetical protein